MAVQDILQVTIEGSLHSQQCLNTFHYRVTVAGAGVQESVLLTAFQTQMETTWLAPLSIDYRLEKYIAQKVAPLPVTIAAQLQPVITPVGTVNNDAVPSSVAVVISKLTALAGRKNRGRVFIPGATESNTSVSQVNPAQFGLWDAIATKMAQSITSGGYTFVPVLYHRQTKTADPIVATVARRFLRNQRRRQLGRGS